MRLIERYWFWAVVGSMIFTITAQAAERPFYQGKNITFLINYAAGGPPTSKAASWRAMWPNIFREIRPSSCKICPARGVSPESIFLVKWLNATV